MTSGSSSGDTTGFILKTLLTLVSSPEGARVFIEVNDWTPLVEVAPKEQHALQIFLWAWIQGEVPTASRRAFEKRVNATIAALVVSFKGTDAVTLLDFMDLFLGRVRDIVGVLMIQEGHSLKRAVC